MALLRLSSIAAAVSFGERQCGLSSHCLNACCGQLPFPVPKTELLGLVRLASKRVGGRLSVFAKFVVNEWSGKPDQSKEFFFFLGHWELQLTNAEIPRSQGEALAAGKLLDPAVLQSLFSIGNDGACL